MIPNIKIIIQLNWAPYQNLNYRAGFLSDQNPL